MPYTLVGHAVIRRAFQFISHAHCIEHAPKNVQFELENFQHALLAFAGGVVLQGDGQTVLHIPASLAQAGAEILVAGGVDPWVMLGPAVEARLDWWICGANNSVRELLAASCQLARRAKLT